jgi:hypothetical protein
MMDHKRRLQVILIVMVALVILVGSALAAGENLPCSVADTGGISVDGVGGLHLESAIGQPASGLLAQNSQSGGLRLCVGYLCGDSYLHVYLPIIDK